MTEFGNYLAGIQAASKKTSTEFAQQMGIDPGSLSRICAGTQKNLRTITLDAICEKASDDPVVRAHLLAARLRDLCVGPSKDRIRITVSGGGKGKPQASASSSSNLITLIRNSNPTEQFNHDLTLIVKAYVKNKLLRTAFHSLAGIAEEII